MRNTHIQTTIIGLATILGSFFVFSHQVDAFFDEIDQLKAELQLWETSHAADFTDIIEQLDDISGPVFQDVDDEDWFNSYVSSLAEWEIVSGYKDGSGKLTGEYKPGNQVTVAEALKMGLKAAEIDEDDCTGAIYNTSADGHWAKQYVVCATEIGVRLFGPTYNADLNRPATRAEVLTIVHDSFEDSVLPIYSNYDDTQGHLYESDIAYASLLGIVGGDSDDLGNPTGTFRPDDEINRAEAAKVIYEKMKQEVRREMSL